MRAASVVCWLALVAAGCSPDLSLEVAVDAGPTPGSTPAPTPAPTPAGSVEEFCRVIAEFNDSDQLEQAIEILLENAAGDRTQARQTLTTALQRFVDAAPPQMRDDAQLVRRVFTDMMAIVAPYAGQDELPDFVDDQLTELIAGRETVAATERLDAFDEEVCGAE